MQRTLLIFVEQSKVGVPQEKFLLKQICPSKQKPIKIGWSSGLNHCKDTTKWIFKFTDHKHYSWTCSCSSCLKYGPEYTWLRKVFEMNVCVHGCREGIYLEGLTHFVWSYRMWYNSNLKYLVSLHIWCVRGQRECICLEEGYLWNKVTTF